jgi:Flp pilus assembly protein TadG
MTAVVVAMSLIPLMGVVAIAVDGGLVMEEKRHVQAAADASALAAAADLYKRYRTNGGVDTPANNANASALTTAAANGYSNDGTNSIVTVRISPQSLFQPITPPPFYVDGNGHLLPGYVEVTIQSNRVRVFSKFKFSDTMPVTARAVARGQWEPSSPGVVALNPTASPAFNASGSANFNAPAATVVIDSSASGALGTSGNGSGTAAEWDITGTDSAGSSLTGTVKQGVPPTPDPLAYLPAPAAPPPGTIASTNIGQGNKQYTLTPGSFSNLPNFKSGDVVIFKQASAGNGGIYYLTSGGLKSTGATIEMDPGTSGGIMIYNAGTGTNDKIDITGNSSGSVTLTGLTDSIYKGLVIFQSRSAGEEIKITGQGTMTITGTLYAKAAQITAVGQGSSDATFNLGSQWIADTVNLSGQGTIQINYNSGNVARGRSFGLVE